jgi:molybdopterin converting factor small subunit
MRFSVNMELRDGETSLRDSDVVGVLPPVAGG